MSKVKKINAVVSGQSHMAMAHVIGTYVSTFSRTFGGDYRFSQYRKVYDNETIVHLPITEQYVAVEIGGEGLLNLSDNN